MAQDEFAQIIEFLRSARQGRELSHTELEADAQRARPGADARAVPGARGQPRAGAGGRARVRGRTGWRATSGACTSAGFATVFGEVRVKRLGYGAPGWTACTRWMRSSTCPPGSTRWGCAAWRPSRPPSVLRGHGGGAWREHTGKTMGKRQVEELVQRAALDFDAFYASAVPRPAGEQPILVLSADGKGVVMLPRDSARGHAQGRTAQSDTSSPSGSPRARSETASAWPRWRRCTRWPPMCARPSRWRAAWPRCMSPPPPRPPVENKRVWASLEKTPEEVARRGLPRGLAPRPRRQKTWVALVDGNTTQLDLLETLSRKHQVKLTIVLDLMHVSEYLWSASVAFHAEASPQREQWVGERLLQCLAGQGRAGGRGHAPQRHAARTVDRAASARGCGGRLPAQPHAVHALSRYLAAGLPIATGVIEGACRHLVCDRMDRGRTLESGGGGGCAASAGTALQR